MSIKHQVAIKSAETFKAKFSIYKDAQSQGVLIKGYEIYNALLDVPYLIEYMLKTRKVLGLSRAGASHKNGECTIC